MAWSTTLLWGSLALASALWLQQVAEHVREPYLDEVFHVRQAQAYCRGHWHIWDPKITTPPGLYLLPALAHLALHTSCRLTSLRLLNVVLNSIFLPWTLASILQRLHAPLGSTAATSDIAHTSLNIAFFPLLFFFSALFYTDTLSTVSVLVCYRASLRLGGGAAGSGLRRSASLFGLGLCAVALRQTNVVWVTVFVGGLDVVRCLTAEGGEEEEEEEGEEEGEGPGEWRWRGRWRRVVARSWARGALCYDPPAAEAGFTDYLLTSVSVALAALAKLPRVVAVLAPYLALMAVFAGFVVWNGGVVLGDRSNHMATLHLPQMLYLWPYLIFFSLPLVAPAMLNMLLSIIGSPRTRGRPPLAQLTTTTITTTLLTLLAIHYNTIIHPFIRADNRHYVFYVFRWFVLRHPLARYGAAPVYLLCARAALSARVLTGNDRPHPRPLRTSFILIWLLTTALALCTAPLVEPRYFILPWLLWRLHLPLPLPLLSSSSSGQQGQVQAAGTRRWMRMRMWMWTWMRMVERAPLWSETAWFALINALTGAVFLFRPFEWPLEKGRVQRFMW
ncbi:MAG: glucosyltransferase [Phylliscum demangeonii]|nr:MAG: glucosyltransferase [Phylliscum demangeonii]